MRLRTYDGSLTVAHLELIDFPRDTPAGCVKKSVEVHNSIPNYDGPKITVDFDSNGLAIGIEILYPSDYLGEPDYESDDEA